MAINRQEQHEAEMKVFQLRHEIGMQSMRALLMLRRDEINKTWPDASGDALLKLQGEAQCVQKMLKVIEHGPAIKTLARDE